MSTALQSLRKLRQFQMEMEEMKLQEKQRLEREQRDAHEAAIVAVSNAVAAKETIGFGNARVHMDTYIREATTTEATTQRQWVIAQKDRMTQTDATLQAKQRRDMIDRLLDRRRLEAQAEEDVKERKALDDVSQSIYHHQPDRGIL